MNFRCRDTGLQEDIIEMNESHLYTDESNEDNIPQYLAIFAASKIKNHAHLHNLS